MTPSEKHALTVNRTDVYINPDPDRVLIRPFIPFGEHRIVNVIARLLALSEAEIEVLLRQVLTEFSERHQKTKDIFLARFEAIRAHLITDQELTEARKIVVGSYFTHEYSLEAAALFNPSIVPHTDQTNLASGALRFILSLRATGEGHLSSITFRTGEIDADNAITITTPTRYVTEARTVDELKYSKPQFVRQLAELGYEGELIQSVMSSLDGPFNLAQLRCAIESVQCQMGSPLNSERSSAAKGLLDLALSNCQISFPPEQRLSERVIFPRSPSQSNGIEDARFLRFQHDDGAHTYFATYTAYDGRATHPQLLETRDFLNFSFSVLTGAAVKNKGMALFPRKIGGRYVMLSRQDNENIFIMFSEELHFWNTATLILKPAFAWEFIQLGNCGSPIETDQGWLVLSHGVGAMRKYSIGAFLLDRDDPTRVLGRLSEPLITAAEDERGGYVPNVVYTCGALVHNQQLIIPYAVSDSSTHFATIPLADVLAAMIPVGHH